MAAGRECGPGGLPGTEDKDRAGIPAWGTCNDSSTQRNSHSGPKQQQLVAAQVDGAGEDQDKGRSHSPPCRRGKGHAVAFPSPGENTQSHYLAAAPPWPLQSSWK